jgi:hypothetical protein
MFRLTAKAFDLLQSEIARCAAKSPAGQIQRQIALKRLEKLLQQPGDRATYNELWAVVDDLFPDFNKAVVEQAARANRPANPFWGRLKLGAIALTTGAAGLWLVNLPYPMIRRPVADVAPILLLPSFMRMDYDYRQAIALVEQADQLVNQATSSADLDLGSTKAKAAQKHLDALPVWFLGYYPGAYCGWFGCTWRFTYDEFQQARKQVGRMEATLFQEKNAYTQLQAADLTVGRAKQQFQGAPNEGEKQAAIAQWQQGMDKLTEVPRETLAGKTAATKLVAYERDFQQRVGFSADNARSGNLIQAARTFAETAQQSAKGEAFPAAQWEEVIQQWQDAIARLEKIDVKDPDYKPAQQLMASYKQRLSQARVRLKAEQSAVQAFDEAETLKEQLVANVDSSTVNRMSSQLQAIESKLKKVQKGTTVYADAQELLGFVRKRLKS